MPTDIAAVVNLHREGSAATPSIISAWRAVRAAKRNSIPAQLVLVLDRPDQATLAIAQQWSARDAQLVTVNEGDLGASRNAAVASVDVDWIAFLDSDDLWGETWLVQAHREATANATDALEVWHPQVNVVFGDHHSLLHHVDSDDPRFRWSRFCLHNAWTALSFVRRQVLCDVPYLRNDLSNGFGFEDWSWNMAILERGGHHRVVADSCHFIKRTGSPSLLSQSQTALRTPYPTADGRRRDERERSVPFEEDRVADAGTHVAAPLDLSEIIFQQIKLASTIEPSVTRTVRGPRDPAALPQNFNTHNTPEQYALEELWSLRTTDRSVAAILDDARSLPGLDERARSLVIAEFTVREVALGRTLGSSGLLEETCATYPQVARLIH